MAKPRRTTTSNEGKDKPHAYDGNWSDRSCDPGRQRGGCCSADILDNDDLSQHDCRKYEVLGHYDKAGAQRDTQLEQWKQHQQPQWKQHRLERDRIELVE
jgi:hypothetical protein